MKKTEIQNPDDVLQSGTETLLTDGPGTDPAAMTGLPNGEALNNSAAESYEAADAVPAPKDPAAGEPDAPAAEADGTVPADAETDAVIPDASEADTADSSDEEPDTAVSDTAAQFAAPAEEPGHSDSTELQKSGAGEDKPAPAKRKLPQLPKNVPFVTIDAKPGVETDADKKKSDLLDLIESMKSGHILTGTVQGMEDSEYGTEPVAVLYHGAFKVMIPAGQLMEPPVIKYDVPRSTVLSYMITRRFGSEIDYIVRGLDPDSGIAVASRMDAMAVKRRQYYFGRDRDGNNLLYEGCLAEGRVVAVLQSRVIVELFGAEVQIGYSELSYQRISGASDLFRTGDRVLTKILTISRNEKTHSVEITASIKQAQENPLSEAIRKYTVGCCYSAKVTMVDVIGVFVEMDGGGECLCSFPNRGRPFPGALATVRIREVDLDRNRMWGSILYWSIP